MAWRRTDTATTVGAMVHRPNGGGGVSWNQGVAKATQGAITTSVTLQLQKRKTLTIVFTTCFGERLLERIQYF